MRTETGQGAPRQDLSKSKPAALIGQRSVLTLVVCALLFALCVSAHAQSPKKIYRVGYLSPRPGIERREEAFGHGLRELGYTEGQNLSIEWRFTKGKTDPFPSLAAELVRLQPDCIVGIGVNAVQ